MPRLFQRLLVTVMTVFMALPVLSAEDTIVLDGETRVLPKVEPATPEALQAAIDRGVRFLIEDQNPNGSWGSPTKTKGLNIYAPIPGAHHAFRAGSTSLALAALLEVAPDHPDAQETIERAENWLMSHIESLRRATGDAIYNVWGHAYSIQRECTHVIMATRQNRTPLPV